MNIVFLDSISFGEDMDFGNLEEIGDLKLYDVTEKKDLKNRIKDAEIIITNKVYLGAEEMKFAPNLKLICVTATGYNNIDIKEAKKRGIVVSNVRNYSTESVSQIVFAYIMEFFNRVADYDKVAKNGEWSESKIFTVLKYPIRDMSGKTLGIIGYGTIGKRVKEIAEAFNMKILIGKLKNREYKDNERVELKELLEKSDIVTIHCPLTEDTKGLIGKKEFKIMKKDAILINTARGAIVDEEALYKALKNKEIAGVAIDVMKKEPPEKENKLFTLDNIIISPHVAWASKESREKLLLGIIENIKKYKNMDCEEIDLCRIEE